MTITLINSDGDPVEIGEGRGDLRSTSVPFDFAGPWWNGRPVSYARIYQSQPWVAIAVMRLLTWSVRVPLKVYRRIDDQERQRLHPNEHPLARAVVDPWERGSMADLVTSLLGPLFVHGNGLTNIEDGPRGQIRFAPVDWRSIMPIRLQPDDPNSEIVGWKDFAGDGEAVRSAETVMHLKWCSPL